LCAKHGINYKKFSISKFIIIYNKIYYLEMESNEKLMQKGSLKFISLVRKIVRVQV